MFRWHSICTLVCSIVHSIFTFYHSKNFNVKNTNLNKCSQQENLCKNFFNNVVKVYVFNHKFFPNHRLLPVFFFSLSFSFLLPFFFSFLSYFPPSSSREISIIKKYKESVYSDLIVYSVLISGIFLLKLR